MVGRLPGWGLLGGLAVFLGVLGVTWAAPSNRQAVLVYYNCRNYRVVEDAVTGAKAKPEAERQLVGRILAELRPDLLGLAEIADRAALQALQADLQQRGIALPHAVLVEGPDPARRLAFLSRWPIVRDASQTHLPFELAGQPQWVQRGLLDVTVELPEGGGRWRLLGVHLKSPRESAAFDAEALRGREAREIRRVLDAFLLEQPDAVVLLWGDLNMTRNAPAWAVLAGVPGTAQRLHPLPLRDVHGMSWTHFWAEAEVYSRIDFILASTAAKRLVDLQRSGVAHPADWAEASDHRPLYVTLSW